MSFNIIQPQVPFTGPDGRISREWYQFLLNLFKSTNSTGSVGSLADVTLLETVDSVGDPGISRRDLQHSDPLLLEIEPWVSDMLAQIARNAQDALLLDVYPQADPQAAAQAVTALVVGASPFVFVASFDGSVIVANGGITNLEFSRDGITFFTTGSFRGMFPLSRGDRLRLGYTVVPNMTFLPR